MKTNDPQVTVTGRLKDTANGEMIVFHLNLMFFQLVFLVNIPGEGEVEAPVYVKFKVRDDRLPIRPTYTTAMRRPARRGVGEADTDGIDDSDTDDGDDTTGPRTAQDAPAEGGAQDGDQDPEGDAGTAW